MRWLPLVLGVLAAAGCARLAVWQLARLDQRRATNAARAVELADTVVLTGVFDFAGDTVVTNRAMNGVPGVWIATPLRQGDSAVLVVRGFTPSPDARTVDLTAYREPESTLVRGVRVDGMVRRVVLPLNPPERFAAVPPPALDDGSHLSYAIQWFAFGLIGLVGGAALSLRQPAARPAARA